jgi:hypothetical protein
MPKVLNDSVKGRQPTLVTERVHRLGHAACPNSRSPFGLERMSLAASVLDRQLDVQVKLFFEVAIGPPKTQRSPETVEPFANHEHGPTPRISLRSTA